MTFVDKVSVSYFGPDPKRISPKDQKRIDLDGLKRAYLTISWSKISDEVYDTICDIAANQYALPMKYMKPIPNSYSYIAQKSQISGKEKDIKNAYIVIEPLNADFFNKISITPINQSLPLGTVITIDASVPFDSEDGKSPERKFIWSNNLCIESDIKSKIQKENPHSLTTEPFCKCVHYGAIDIGSRITAKYEVSVVDTDIIKSFSMFGFARDDDKKIFTIWTYKCYNITPLTILELLKKQPKLKPTTINIIDEIIKKSPKIEY